MVNRDHITKQGLALIPVTFSVADDQEGATWPANTETAIPECLRGGHNLGEIVSAYISSPGDPEFIPLTPVNYKDPATLAADEIELCSDTTFAVGTAGAIGGDPQAFDMLHMLCRAGYAYEDHPECPTARAKMANKGLSLFTVIVRGKAIPHNTSTEIPACMRANLNIGKILSAWVIDENPLGGGTSMLTVLPPGTDNPGDDEIRLDSDNENQVILDVGGGGGVEGEINTLVMHVVAGASAGPFKARPHLTDKGLASFLIPYTPDAAISGTDEEILAEYFRASRALENPHGLMTAGYIDADDASVVPLTVVNDAPDAADEIQLNSNVSFIYGTVASDDIQNVDWVMLFVRASGYYPNIPT